MENLKLYGIKAMLLLCLFVSVCSSCDPKDYKEELTPLQQANSFVYNYNELYYLWNDKVNYNFDYKNQTDPFALFDRLIYKELDQWSYLTDDSQSLFEGYEGVETTYGYRLTVIYFQQLNEYAALVDFVYPGSPAERAGIKRGDLIYLIDGSPITESNYMNLYYSSATLLELGTFDPKTGKLSQTGTTFYMNAVKMEIDPVIAYRIIEDGNHKIGYICYTDYVVSSHAKLNRICDEFKSKGVTDIVLDLRYNLGGAAVSSAYVSSLFAPKANVSKGDIFLREIWNDQLTQYWKNNKEDLIQTFDNSALTHNLNLDRIFILTTSSTASASEATIVGLKPYMDVVTIGEKTHGKYCAALLLQPVDKDGELLPDIYNWAMSLVAYKFANKDGFTDFTGGLEPTYTVEDNILNVFPFGDTSDPALAKAIETITGRKASGVQTCSPYAKSDSSYGVDSHTTRRLNGNRGGMVIIRD